jgi:histidine triad (HIT) family protein
MEEDNCIFCKIVNNQIPCSKIFENEKIMAFLDLSPVNKGHALVIPKEHHKDLLDMPEATLSELTKAAKKVAKAVVKATKADGFNIGQNNGKAAGQIVFHFHLHVIPRFENDGLVPWPQGKYEEGEMDRLAKEISSIL